MAADDGGGGGTSNWRDVLPPELRADQSLAQVPDVPTLAKNYLHSQRMIGDRFPLPKSDWKPEQWSEHWTRLGRPDAPDKYKLPEFKFADGFPQIAEDKLKGSLKVLHDLGLTQPQVEGVLKHHFTDLDSAYKSDQERRKVSHAEGMNKLRDHFGSEDKLGFALDRAKAALQKLGGDEKQFESLLTFLDRKNLDNDPAFIILLSKVGEMVMEDRANGGSSTEFKGSAAQAALEIDRLSKDAEFQKALQDPAAPGHVEALERWKAAHYQAYPGKQENN
jgi:hypothetical protein